MQVLVIYELGLKMPIHAQYGLFWRQEQSHSDLQKALSFAETRHVVLVVKIGSPTRARRDPSIK